MSLPDPYYSHAGVTIYHADCREIVPHLGSYDLLLTDPPYGIGADKEMSKKRVGMRNGKPILRGQYERTEWDSAPIPMRLMNAIRKLCKKQIIWGGNYYPLPPCVGWLIWDKENGACDFADGEAAWNNLGCALRIKRHLWNGMFRKGVEKRDHPTQKPLEVIAWALSLAGDVRTAFDPFAGSGTTGVACMDAGISCTLIEREERYCEIAARRIENNTPPLGLVIPPAPTHQHMELI